MNCFWSDQDVHELVSTQINYYDNSSLAPEYTKTETSPWKEWLWLERQGFDFAYQSLEREINRLRYGLAPNGVLLADERRLLVRVRERMRAILDLPPLRESDIQYLLNIAPISNWTHWREVRTVDIKPSDDFYYDDAIEFTWSYLNRDKPNYLDILRKISVYDAKNPETFNDTYTTNGEYQYLMGPALKPEVVFAVCRHHIIRACDMFFVPGSSDVYNNFVRLFLASAQAKFEWCRV